MNYVATPFEIINLGNNRTVELGALIAAMESVIGRKARIEREPEQPGDVPQTWADLTKAAALLGYHPEMPLLDGLRCFVDWLVGVPSQALPRASGSLVSSNDSPLSQYGVPALVDQP
jgi:UDP-glucuronate 4-epimerase